MVRGLGLPRMYARPFYWALAGGAPDDSNKSGPTNDASRLRAQFAHYFPGLKYTDLTEPQIFGYQQQMPGLVREKAQLETELNFIRFAPLLGAKAAGLA